MSRTRIVDRATPAELLRMLESGEIDLWATGDIAGRHQMRQSAKHANAFEVVHTLSENDLYYVFSRDVPATLASINNREAPYRDARDPGLYVFVYDLNTTIVAHADNRLVIGVNFHGKGDVEDTPLHDRIRDGALRDGSGWVHYVFLHPVQMNLYYKSACYRLARGSDCQPYIVASGNYRRCE